MKLLHGKTAQNKKHFKSIANDILKSKNALQLEEDSRYFTLKNEDLIKDIISDLNHVENKIKQLVKEL